MTGVPRQVGDRIQERWEIHQVHSGGLGLVYIVYDHETQRPYAAKSFQAHLWAQAPGLSDRFQQAAQTWINLGAHPNVVQAHFLAPLDDQPFLFLEHVSAGTLADWVGTPRLTQDLAQVLRFTLHCCDGMIHARSAGMSVHRDLKPQNCLLTPERTLKISDGGLAAIFTGLSLPPEAVDTVAVRATHLAPELFDDPAAASVRSDIYAFGVMLFQMLTGTLPFEAPTRAELARVHQQQPPAALSDPFTGLNPLMAGCLAKDPHQRLGDFGLLRELVATLYTHLTGAPAPQPLTATALQAMQHDSIGTSLLSLGRAQEALHWHEEALALQPQYEPALVHQSMVLEALDRHEEALALCDRALALNPKHETAMVHKGLVLGVLGRMQEARSACDQALALNPRNEQAWVNMGVVLDALERRPEALACYNNAVTLNPRLEHAWFNAAVLLADLEKHDEALRCCERTLAINPDNERAWVNMGLTLRELQRTEEALACLDRALAVNPHFDQAWFNKGVLLVNEFERYAEALSCFEAAARLGYGQAADGIAVCRQALE